MTVLELIRERIEAPLALADRAYAGQADPADPWTRVGRHAYELDEPLAWKAEPEPAPVLSSFDPDAPGREPTWDPASSNQYALLDTFVEVGTLLHGGNDWSGYTRSQLNAYAQKLRRIHTTTGTLEAELSAYAAMPHTGRRQYGKVSRRSRG